VGQYGWCSQGKSVSSPPKCDPIQQEYINQGFLYEHHLPNLSFLTNCKSMNWVPFADSLEGGSIANPFQFTDTSEEAFHSLNSQLQLIMNGEAAPSLADAQVLLKTKITMEWGVGPVSQKLAARKKDRWPPSKHK